MKHYYIPLEIKRPDGYIRPPGVKGVLVVYKSRKQAEEENPGAHIIVIEEKPE